MKAQIISLLSRLAEFLWLLRYFFPPRRGFKTVDSAGFSCTTETLILVILLSYSRMLHHRRLPLLAASVQKIENKRVPQ